MWRETRKRRATSAWGQPAATSRTSSSRVSGVSRALRWAMRVSSPRYCRAVYTQQRARPLTLSTTYVGTTSSPGQIGGRDLRPARNLPLRDRRLSGSTGNLGSSIGFSLRARVDAAGGGACTLVDRTQARPARRRDSPAPTSGSRHAATGAVSPGRLYSGDGHPRVRSAPPASASLLGQSRDSGTDEGRHRDTRNELSVATSDIWASRAEAWSFFNPKSRLEASETTSLPSRRMCHGHAATTSRPSP